LIEGETIAAIGEALDVDADAVIDAAGMYVLPGGEMPFGGTVSCDGFTSGTVATVGEIAFEPGLINVVAGRARLSLDTRGVSEHAYTSIARDVEAFAQAAARRRHLQAGYRERQRAPVTVMDVTIFAALDPAAELAGEPYMCVSSGAAHDTMCFADQTPTARVFVPCHDGISHSPDEQADSADAALGAEVILNAVSALTERTGT
jgi:acetylornithine deacetylase/succinyl-diaminopimelate desuccinylase-like protein